MKKTSVFLLLFVLLILTSCGGKSSTTSFLKVTEKGHSDNYEEYWIKAYDPNNETEDVAFKIMVDEVMVWNLIEEDKEYFTTYSKTGNKPWTLIHIEHTLYRE
ncbi:hypothetical protein M3152_14335 [Sporosarcina luteola]|uniref:hypothetical protein n=1 Tax=Sporosarcina luteola TaxID=582850 RepID=UPI00204038B4|nr:hypothetical protein [Sporosarcina luteola]MCM3638877.1 hypothetical protein [Sporosarcina luteola]